MNRRLFISCGLFYICTACSSLNIRDKQSTINFYLERLQTSIDEVELNAVEVNKDNDTDYERKIEEDFRNERYLILNGWTLSYTEIRLLKDFL